MAKPNVKSIADALAKGTMAPQKGEAVQKIAMDKLQPGKFQPRHQFNDDTIRELATSIEEQGIIQPIVVRAIEGGNYEIVSGERRFRACQLIKRKEIEAIVRDLDDRQTLAMALAENIDREDMSLLDEAEGVARLVEMEGAPGKAAEQLGKSGKWVSYRLSISKSPEPIQRFLKAGYSRDAAGFYELVQLYKANETAAASLMKEWDEKPDVRSSLRSQVMRLREVLAERKEDIGQDIPLPLDMPEAKEVNNGAVDERQAVAEVVGSVIEEVTQKTTKKKEKSGEVNISPSTSTLKMPPIRVENVREEYKKIVLDTDEGEISLDMSDAAKAALRAILQVENEA